MSLLFAGLLGCAALAAWIVAAAARQDARRNVRFASLLYAALAAAGIIAGYSDPDTAQLVLVVGLLVSALAPPLLALAAYSALSRPLFSTWAAVALVLTCLAGVFAVITGLAILALIPQTIAIIALFVLGLRASRDMAWRLCLSAAALFAGALSVVADSHDAGMVFSLFSAAGLLGVARALARPQNGI